MRKKKKRSQKEFAGRREWEMGKIGKLSQLSQPAASTTENLFEPATLIVYYIQTGRPGNSWLLARPQLVDHSRIEKNLSFPNLLLFLSQY